MLIYTDNPCDDGAMPSGLPLISSLGVNPKITKTIDTATKDWLDKHPEATTTVVDKSIDASKIAPNAADGLRIMNRSQLGVAKVGTGLAVDNDGALGLDGGNIAPAVTAWLDAHPEATTTVQDGAITTPKLAQDVRSVLNEIERNADVNMYQNIVYDAFSQFTELNDIKRFVPYNIFSGERRNTRIGDFPSESLNTICTGFIKRIPKTIITASNGYKILIAKFDSSGNYIGISGGYTTEPIDLVNIDCAYYAVEVRNSDTSTFPLNEFDYRNLTIELYDVGNIISNVVLRNANASIIDLEDNKQKQNNKTTEALTAYPTKYNFSGNIETFPWPDTAFNDYDFNIYTDWYNFYTDFNPLKFKNNVLRTFYLSPDGNDTNVGTLENAPRKTIRSMTSRIQDGDTFIFLDGVYDRETLPITINNSINLIAKNKHKAVLTMGDNNYVFTIVSGYTNVWHTTRSNVSGVLFKFLDDVYKRLFAASSLDELAVTPFAFYGSGSDLYINVGGYIPSNDNVILNLDLSRPVINVDSGTQNVNLYIDGLDLIGGTQGTVLFSNSVDYQDSVLCAVDCKFLDGQGMNYNAISMLGCDSYFVNCIAAYADRDGFNYHKANGKTAKHLEIGCQAYCNGLFNNEDNNNGTTSHDGEIAIRINGIYHDNKGPNMNDTAANIGEKTLFLRCVGFNSRAVTDGMNCDIKNSEEIEAWVIACNCSGSKFSLSNSTGSTMHLKNNIYVNRNGGGIFDDM